MCTDLLDIQNRLSLLPPPCSSPADIRQDPIGDCNPWLTGKLQVLYNTHRYPSSVRVYYMIHTSQQYNTRKTGTNRDIPVAQRTHLFTRVWS